MPAKSKRFLNYRNDETFSSRKLLLATAVVDHLPDIEGLNPLYVGPFSIVLTARFVVGISDCDLGREIAVGGLALELTVWAWIWFICTDCAATIFIRRREQLASLNIPIHEDVLPPRRH